MVSFNPACYLPSALSNALPSTLACPPPPSTAYKIYASLTTPFTSSFKILKSSMDLLMSLPFLSFLLVPTMTSYSTSLNLLFFYLTWSTLLLSHSPLRVEIVGCLAVKVLFYVLPSLLFLAFDVFVPSLSESFKTLGSTALPMRNLSRRNSLRQVRVLAWSLLNILIGIALQACIEYILVEVLGRKSALKVTTTLPLPWGILKDVIRGLLLRDLLTFLIHRYLLHSEHTRQGLFSTLTRAHNNWYHKSIPAPFPLSPTYDHPLAYILKIFIPTYLPAYLWRFHMLTYIVYLLLISLEETFTHSGYAKLPTNFVLGGIARRNEMHCLSHGQGNFGTWGLADWIWDTSIGGDAAEELLDEVMEGQVQEKMARQVKRGVKGVKAGKRRLSAAESGYGTGTGVGSGSGGAAKSRKAGNPRRRSTRRKSDDSDYAE